MKNLENYSIDFVSPEPSNGRSRGGVVIEKSHGSVEAEKNEERERESGGKKRKEIGRAHV